jgi:alpha-D-ribose 1-methylphosphonate 5-triphosphate synthase subunit PhnH
VTITGSLSPLASQEAFRILLDTLAHPGRVAVLDVPVGVPASLMVALTLADLTQRAAVVGVEADRWEALLVAATSCLITEPNEADIVVVLQGAATPDLVAGLRRGSALAPEDGTRLAIGCSFLGAGCEVARRLHGPGIDGTVEVGVDGVDAAVFEAVADANRGFPAGIDVWLIADDAAIVGMPRSTVSQPAGGRPWAT